MEFYICDRCGNIVTFAENKGVPVFCCGERMNKVNPKTADSATEKHVPLVKTEGNLVTVTVGSTEHPMTEEHAIGWIVLETKQGRQRKMLQPGQKPEAVFALVEGDEVVAAYEYCNLHGLWKS